MSAGDAKAEAGDPRIAVETALGVMELVLYRRRAPASCDFILSLVDRGVFDPCGIFRIITEENHESPTLPRVHALQLGHPCADPDTPVLIPHEHTGITGLTHRRGVVSLPRFRPGATYHSLFICYQDDPCLDLGGRRNPDRLGFAAFGQLVSGFDVLDRVVQQSGPREYLDSAMPVSRIARTT